MKINVRSDVNKMLRANDGLRDELLKAAAKAVNETATKVRAAAIDEIGSRNTGYTKATLKGYVTMRKATYRAPRVTKSGAMRANYGGITATVTAAGKAPNLIYFVPPGSRRPDAFRASSGVSARVGGKSNQYDGTFIVKARGGKMVVVARSDKAKRSPHLMRPRGSKGKWQRNWSKGIYGPPLKILAAQRTTQQAMHEVAMREWPLAWKKFSSAVTAGG